MTPAQCEAFAQLKAGGDDILAMLLVEAKKHFIAKVAESAATSAASPGPQQLAEDTARYEKANELFEAAEGAVADESALRRYLRNGVGAAPLRALLDHDRAPTPNTAVTDNVERLNRVYNGVAWQRDEMRHALTVGGICARAQQRSREHFDALLAHIESDFYPSVVACQGRVASLHDALRLLVAFGLKPPPELLAKSMGAAAAPGSSMSEVYLIDLGDMHARNMTNDDECVKWISSIGIEANEACNALLAFDLDSLADVGKEYGGLTDDLHDSSLFGADTAAAQLSYRVARPALLSAALLQFRSVDAARARWTVGIARCGGSSHLALLCAHM